MLKDPYRDRFFDYGVVYVFNQLWITQFPHKLDELFEGHLFLRVLVVISENNISENIKL